jgi:predicted N-formylglutamate amidohydrolase
MQRCTIISCEHAGNHVPPAYRYLFDGLDDVLQSHRGWDPGAEEMALMLADKLDTALHTCQTTRLLVEPNRSLDHPELFSEFTRGLAPALKAELVATYYQPYREKVTRSILAANQPVLHLSIHSFTPVFDNAIRTVDIGLLFDPEREHELHCCMLMKEELASAFKGYSIKFNEPYRGIDDGFTTYLRTRFPDERYAGIEVEVNQKFDRLARLEIANALAKSVRLLLD